ncbi:chromosome (plasmid) partitioning protein ParA [alpha proteobacterium U9-1i]|nr:chromosome (plasmid) partitioning protein ParA [alpha proteobacterium U9-1i]
MTNAAFISCSGEDLEQAKVLENLLDHAGLPAWVYTKPLTGSQFPTEITEAITTSSCVIVLVSPSSASSAWVGRELHFAQENGIPIVPVLVKPTPTNSALHLRIAGMSRIDATKGFAGEAFDELCRAVKAHYRRLNPIVAVMNMKGGVGKTTLSANIFGGLFKWRHKNVLLVDLDPQYNLTQLLVHQRTHLALVEQDRSVISAFEPGRPLGRESPTRELTKISTFDGAPIDPTEIAHRLEFDPDSRARFDLILGQFEIAKYTLPQNTRRVDACMAYFKRFLDLARSKYDLVVIDVSPASSHLTLAAVSAATHVLAPVRPDKYSLRGLKAMRRLMDELFALEEQPEFLAVMNDVAPDSPTDVEEDIRNDREFGASLLKTIIPHSRYFFARNTGAVQNPAERLAINARGWHSSNIQDVLRTAGDELMERVSGHAATIDRNVGDTAEVNQEI